MQTIKDFLNKIKWDKELNASEFSVYYLDNVSKKFVELKFSDIIRTEGNFIVIIKDFEETYIPMHRIREARQNGKTVWKR